MANTPTPEFPDSSEPTPGASPNGAGHLPRDDRGRFLTRKQRQQAKAAAAAAETDEEKARRRRRRIILLLLLLLILLLLCGCLGYWWKKHNEPDPTVSPTPVATSSSLTSPSPAASPSPVASPSPSPSPVVVLVEVPTVVGMTAAEAQSVLQEAGFTNVVFQDQSGATITPTVSWIVTSQTPAGGSKAAVDTQITVVSKPQTNGKG